MTPILYNGYYVALFPMDYLRLTQTWGANTLSHRDHQTDWAGASSEYPYYAPCPMRCYGTTTSGFLWTSTTQVWTPSGLSYISIWVAHDNNASRASVGSTVAAGGLLGRTGTRGYATGDHLHLDCALGEAVATATDHLSGDVSPTSVFYLVSGQYTISNLTANGITLSFSYWTDGGDTPEPEPEPEPAYYTLTVSGGTAGTTRATAGTSTTVTVTIPKGYKFARWELSGSGSISSILDRSITFTFGEGSATITAIFVKKLSALLYTMPHVYKNQFLN